MRLLHLLVFPQKWLILCGLFVLAVMFSPSVPSTIAGTTIIYSNAGTATAWGAYVDRSGSGLAVNSANRPAGTHGSAIVPYVNGQTYWAVWRNTEFGEVINGPETDPTTEDNMTVVVWWNGGGGPLEPAPDPWRYDRCFTNTTLYTRIVTPVVGGIPGIGKTFAPGQVDCFSFVYEEKELIQFHIDLYAPDGTNVGQEIDTVSPSDPAWYQDDEQNPANTISTPFAVEVPRDTRTITNNPIEFSLVATNLALDDSVKTGFGALQTATVTGLEAINAELKRQTAELGQVDAAMSSGFVNVNGNLQAVGTKIDSSNTKLDTLNSSIGSQTATLGGKIDTLNNNVSLQTHDLDLVRQHTETLTNVAVTINRQLITNDNRVLTIYNVLTNKLPAGNDKVASEATAAEIAEKIQSFADQQDNDETNADNRRGTANNLLYDIEANTQDTATTLNNNLPGIRDDVQDNTEALDAVRAALEQELDVSDDDANQILGSLSNLLNQANQKLESIRTNTEPVYGSSGQMSSFSNAFFSGAAGHINAASNSASGILTNADSGESMAQGVGEGMLINDLPEDSFWVVNIAGHEVDMNPLHLPFFNDIASWLRNLTAWMSAAMSMFYISRGIWKLFSDLGALERGATSLFNNIIDWKPPTWGYIPFIMAASAAAFGLFLLVIVGFSVPIFSTYVWSGSPFDIFWLYSGTGGGGGGSGGPLTDTNESVILQGILLANQFVALDLMLLHFCWTIAFNFLMAKCVMIGLIVTGAVPK